MIDYGSVTKEVIDFITFNGNIMTNTRFLEEEIVEWKTSQARLNQYTAERYYTGDHDILMRERTAIGNNGDLEAVDNLPNNRLVDNQYAKLVDQKKNYLLSKPITFEAENESLQLEIDAMATNRFLNTVKNNGEGSINHGIGYLYVYYNQSGELAIKRFSAYQILPFWADQEHTQLDSFVRWYEAEVYEGTTKKIVEKVEYYTLEGIYYFDLVNNVLKTDNDQPTPYFNAKGKAYNWERIPLIPFKANNREIPLIVRVKSLQDGINIMLSDFENNMQEDARNTIIVLKNYDGENLGEFRRNLATYGAVKVRSGQGEDGGVETLTVEVNSENYKAILDIFKKAIIENGRGFDSKDDRLKGTPNQMNIQSMYSDMDLDANDMESEYQAAFEDLFWFLKVHLANSGRGNFMNEKIKVIFNRDILINESESINNAKNSIGLLSTETIVSQHPWVKDVAEEMKRLSEEKQSEMDEYNKLIVQQQGSDMNAQ